jgi:colanic acid biosynthesis glycosyl transferase WcaI
VVVSQGVGTSYLEREKNQQALDNLILLPLQPFSELSMVLAASDVAVATIEPDAGMFSVPSKVQSYLCAGRAVLLAAPRENLASEVIRNSGAGLVVEPTDKSDFLKAALRLLDDNDLRTKSATKGRKFALENYDVEHIADRFETVFKYAIDAKTARKEM